MFEFDMVNQCYDFLQNNHTDYECIIKEVPFLSRCIDMVIITKTQKIITIEFKIKNWHQALEQAKNHRLGADHSYICIPEKKPSEKLLNSLIAENIGLFLYNPSSDSCLMFEYFPAPYNNKKVKIFNEMLVNTARNISCNIKNVSKEIKCHQSSNMDISYQKEP